MNNPRSKYTQLDAGHMIINICAEEGKHGLTFTAYINGLSVKSPALRLARMVRVFIETVIAACDYPDDELSDTHAEKLSEDLASYIDDCIQIDNLNSNTQQ